MTARTTGVSSVTRMQRYGIAILAVMIAAVVCLALRPVLEDDMPVFLFIVPVVLAGFTGGLWPALLATTLSLLVLRYPWAGRDAYQLDSPLKAWITVAFGLLGITLGVLFEKVHRKNAELGKMTDNIAEHQRAEELWFGNQQLVQRIVDSSPGVIFVYDMKTRKSVFVNRGILAGLGYASGREAEEEFIHSAMHPDDWEQFLQHTGLLANLRDDETAEFQFRMRGSGSEWRWFHSSERVFTRNDDNSVREVICAATDVTERRNGEEKTKFMAALNEAFLPLADPEKIMAVAVRMLGEHLSVDRCGYAEVDADGDHFVVLDEYVRDDIPKIVGRYRMSDFGFNEQEVLRENRPYVVDDIETDTPPGTDLALYRRGQIRAMVCIPLNKAGRFMARMAVHQATPRRWTNDEIKLITTVANRCWESVERARAARALRESDERYRAFIANSSEAIWRFELEQPIRLDLSEDEQREQLYQYAYLAECNDAMARMYGYSNVGEILGARIGDLLPQSDPLNIDFFRCLRRSGTRLTDVETHEHDRYGNSKYFLNNLTLIQENNAIVRCWGTQRDITAQKLAGEALRESEERLRRITEATQDALWEIDLKTNHLWWSEGAKPLFGHSPGDLQIALEDWYKAIHPEDADRVRAKFESFMQGSASEWVDEYRFRRADGSYVEIHDKGRKFYNGSQVPLRIAGAMADITNRKRAEQALHESEERFETAFKTSPDALVISRIDDGIILEVNESFVALSGFDQNEMIGKSTLQLDLYVDPADRQRMVDILKQQNHVRDFEFAMRRKSGEVRRMTFSAEALDIRGQHCWLTIGRDVTEQRQAEEERDRHLQQEKAAREDAEAAGRIKDEFLATMSHELRTPLTSILGWARMLNSGAVPQAQIPRALQVIEQNAKSQARLVDDILDTSRIITGRLKLDFQFVDIERVLQAAVDVIRPSAEAKRVNLRLSIDDLGGMVLGDANRLQQIIWNLLSNAVKFTNECGRVEVRLSRAGGQIEISITDSGVGIEAEFMPHIFERFRQADSTSTRKYGGLGLGLAIVRHLVEMHGGSVSASSPGVGQGATFTVRFPSASGPRQTAGEIRPAEPVLTQPAQRHAVEGRQDLNGARVLVVDDDPDTLDMLRFVLDERGAEVITAASTSQAFKVLERWKPDALVSDLAMPDQDGYELIGQVRSLDAAHGGNVPAVALSAYTKTEDRIRALSAGFQMHVPKPVDPDELVAVLASLTGRIHCLDR